MNKEEKFTRLEKDVEYYYNSWFFENITNQIYVHDENKRDELVAFNFKKNFKWKKLHKESLKFYIEYLKNEKSKYKYINLKEDLKENFLNCMTYYALSKHLNFKDSRQNINKVLPWVEDKNGELFKHNFIDFFKLAIKNEIYNHFYDNSISVDDILRDVLFYQTFSLVVKKSMEKELEEYIRKDFQENDLNDENTLKVKSKYFNSSWKDFMDKQLKHLFEKILSVIAEEKDNEVFAKKYFNIWKQYIKSVNVISEERNYSRYISVVPKKDLKELIETNKKYLDYHFNISLHKKLLKARFDDVLEILNKNTDVLMQEEIIYKKEISINKEIIGNIFENDQVFSSSFRDVIIKENRNDLNITLYSKKPINLEQMEIIKMINELTKGVDGIDENVRLTIIRELELQSFIKDKKETQNIKPKI